MFVVLERGLCVLFVIVCFQAEDGIRDLVRSRGLGDVYKRQPPRRVARSEAAGRSCRCGPCVRGCELCDSGWGLRLSLIHI